MEETKKGTVEKEKGKTKEGAYVAKELTKNILRYYLDELQMLLHDYALNCDPSMLHPGTMPENKEFDEEICLAFTDPEKNLQMQFEGQEEWKPDGRRFVFSFTGRYAQYKTDKYYYRDGGNLGARWTEENLRKLLEDEGIEILSCWSHWSQQDDRSGFEREAWPEEYITSLRYAQDKKNKDGKMLGVNLPDFTEGDRWLEYYCTDIELVLDKPFHHDGLRLTGRVLASPLTKLEEREFALQLVIEGKCISDKGADEPATHVLFETMYLRDPKSKRKTKLEIPLRNRNKQSALLPFAGEIVYPKPEGEVLRLGVLPELDKMLRYPLEECTWSWGGFSREELIDQLSSKLKEALFWENDALIDLDEPHEKASSAQRAKKILEDYLYFNANAYDMRRNDSHPELRRSRYNLMLVADDMSRAEQFVEILHEILKMVSLHVYKKYRESDLLDGDSWSEMAMALRQSDHLVVIYDCQERPAYKPDELGTGEAQEVQKRKIARYDSLWKQIGRAARGLEDEHESPGMLIIIASRRTYARTLRLNPIIHDFVCEHHLAIRDLLPEEVSELFIKKIEQSSFEVNDSLRKEIKAYVDAEYSKSSQRGMEFIDTRFEKFLNRYLLKENRDGTLSGCIPSVKKSSAEEILVELSEKPGMEGVVDSLKKVYHMKDVLLRMNDVCHMSFEGNPGTGKTMVARKMAEMLYYMGVIKKPLCIEVAAGDFLSKFYGTTNEKVTEMLRSAQGGVLFIDEAYLLAENDGNANKSKQEGIGLLIREMEDKENPDRPLVIFAGYEDRMRDLLKTNAGLNSRIKFHIKFRDYKIDELYKILKLMLEKVGFEVAKKAEYSEYLEYEEYAEEEEDDDKTKEKLNQLIRVRMSATDFGNARAMEQLAEELAAKHAEREAEKHLDASQQDVIEAKRGNTYVIEAEDAEALLPKTDTQQIAKILKTQPKVEAEFEKLKAGIAFRKSLQRAGLSVHIPVASHHMVFMGAPGTGKTTVAKLLADYLCEVEALPTGKLVTVQIQDLENFAGGMTPARRMEEFVERARGGILFIDEAYTLMYKNWREDVIQVLLVKMEERREDTVFIFAGYPNEMDRFMTMNEGLKSRIGYHFLFESYKEDALAQMFLDKMEQAGLKFDDEGKARKKLEEIMRYCISMPDFGNGRFVDNLFENTVNKHGDNLFGNTDNKHDEKLREDYSTEELTTFKAETDLPAISEILSSMGIEADPKEYAEHASKKTAIHELGHAVVLVASKESMTAGAQRMDGYSLNIEEVTIRPTYGAGGYMKLENLNFNSMTEREWKTYLTIGMAGRAAEKLYFGSHTPGCSGDYKTVRYYADQMIETFAMGDLGITSPMDLVREADETASRLIVENREFIDITVKFLQQFEEMKGAEFEEAFRKYRTEGGEALTAYLEEIGQLKK